MKTEQIQQIHKSVFYLTYWFSLSQINVTSKLMGILVRHKCKRIEIIGEFYRVENMDKSDLGSLGQLYNLRLKVWNFETTRKTNNQSQQVNRMILKLLLPILSAPLRYKSLMTWTHLTFSRASEIDFHKWKTKI